MADEVDAQLIPELVRQILAGRGMEPEEMATFLYPDYDRDLHDPFLMTDMEAAVRRIAAAREAREQVAVYGDYDIDGITATAVMLEVLAAVGVDARGYIPDRFEEGYGINQGALERLQESGVGLVVSVDCGITSVAEAQWAREHGLDLVITDHHTVPAELPNAVAVVNPKRPGDAYPFKELAGVGVAFKLAVALASRLGGLAAGQEKWLLDLVALGTVCDVVPLVGENRVLVSYGLRVLRRTRRPGLLALAAVGGVEPASLSADHLGFVLGPRMNAAGRVEHAHASLELMRTDDVTRARELANELDGLNRQRRETQAKVLESAEAMAAERPDDEVLVLAAPDWSHGVVGIVASNLVEKWHKPVLVAQIMGDEVKGSARSVLGFDMVEALRANASLLTKFGGHVFAAGFTLPVAQLDAFRAGLNEYYRLSGAAEVVAPDEKADVRLEGLDRAKLEILEELELLEPHGRGNLAPNFVLEGLVVAEAKRVGATQKHLRLVFQDATGKRLTAIGFGLAEAYADIQPGQQLTAWGKLNKNEYLGRTSLQLRLSKLDYE